MEFPQPEPADNDDVAWAIQTANTMHKRGDHAEAMRWLQRAAEAAEAAGDDMRLLALARAAAEFAPKPAAAPAAAPQRPPPPPQRPSPQTRPLPTRPLPKPAHATSQPPHATSQQPPPPQRRQRTVPGGMTARVSDPGIDEVTKVYVDKPDAPGENHAPVPAPPPAPHPAITSTLPSATTPLPLSRSVTPSPVVPVSGERRAEHRALRVAVLPAASPGTFLVRGLGRDERVPAGAREALLVPLHADDDFAS